LSLRQKDEHSSQRDQSAGESQPALPLSGKDSGQQHLEHYPRQQNSNREYS
jgi:hypothetical protein